MSFQSAGSELLRRLGWTTGAYLAWIASYESVGWYASKLRTHDLSALFAREERE